MKSKRFLAMLLAAVMVMTAIFSTGCSKKENNEQSEKSGIVTLNMFIITDEATSEQSKLEVQWEINKITVPQHKTLVKLNYITGEEYWDIVDAAEAETVDYIESKGTGSGETAKLKKLYLESKVAEEAEGEEAEKVIKFDNEATDLAKLNFVDAVDYVMNGFRTEDELNALSESEKKNLMNLAPKDITLLNPQIDIFLVDTYDKFTELAKDERLAEIDIKYDRKVVTQYIHPTILSTTQVKGKTYGIPANFAMPGKYEFLVFNKALLDKYGFSVGELDEIESERMAEYLGLIKANEPGVYPISELPEFAGAEIYDDILFARSQLDTISGTSFPIYINNGAYIEYLKAADTYNKSGYVAAFDGVENAKYAVELVKSSTLIEDEWVGEDGVTYQAYLYDIPRVTAAEAFSSALCVSAQSMNKAKAAELIELLTIDSELANLLQYGIAEKHYTVKDGPFRYLDVPEEEAYVMDNRYTGNAYIKYEEEEGAIQFAMDSNLSTAPSAFFGFTPDFKDDAADEATYNFVKIFSAKALEMVANGEISVDDAFNIAARQLNAIGCKWNDSGSALLGLFGEIGMAQSEQAKKSTSNFVLAEEAEVFNDVYLTAEELEEIRKAEEAAKLAAEEAAKKAEEEALLARIEAENEAKEKAEAEEEEPDPTEELAEEAVEETAEAAE